MNNSDIKPNIKENCNMGEFRMWCQKVIPLVYDDSMSYYELLCKVVEKVNSMVVSVNDIGEGFNEVVAEFNELKVYVDDYFNSLDIQGEIDKKLDQMVTDGTFDEIMSKLIKDYVISFNSVQDMKNSNNLDIGSTCITLGYYEPNDGGGGTYLIKDKALLKEDLKNINLHILLNNNNIAELIYGDFVELKQVGGKVNGIDDDSILINRLIQKQFNINVLNGEKILINNPIILNKRTILNCYKDIEYTGMETAIMIEERHTTFNFEKIEAKNGSCIELNGNNYHTWYNTINGKQLWFKKEGIKFISLTNYGVSLNRINFLQQQCYDRTNIESIGIYSECGITSDKGWITDNTIDCKVVDGYTGIKLINSESFYINNPDVELCHTGIALNHSSQNIFDNVRMVEPVEGNYFELINGSAPNIFNCDSIHGDKIKIENTKGKIEFNGIIDESIKGSKIGYNLICYDGIFSYTPLSINKGVYNAGGEINVDLYISYNNSPIKALTEYVLCSTSTETTFTVYPEYYYQNSINKGRPITFQYLGKRIIIKSFTGVTIFDSSNETLSFYDKIIIQSLYYNPDVSSSETWKYEIIKNKK